METVRHPDVEIAVHATQVAAEIIRSAYLGPLTQYAKVGDDFATQADLAAEQAILDVLADACPGDRFVGEESGESGAAGSARTWLIDPLCGTRNFAVGTPSVAVNVALRTGDTVTAAAVGAPFSGEVFWTGGDGAFVRRDGTDRRLRPSAGNLLVDVDLDDPLPWSSAAALFDAPGFAGVFHPRALSTSLALVWVAAGRRAAYVTGVEVSESVHFAAAVAVCRAAGCAVTGVAGQDLRAAPYGLVAAADADTNARLVAAIAGLR